MSKKLEFLQYQVKHIGVKNAEKLTISECLEWLDIWEKARKEAPSTEVSKTKDRPKEKIFKFEGRFWETTYFHSGIPVGIKLI